MKIEYTSKRFSSSSLEIIEQANAIIEEYQADGLTLTLRQLYYQFVSRDLLSNTQQSYSRLGSIINDGRLAGEIDWEAIEDRTRKTKIPTRWESPGEIVKAAVRTYHEDWWIGQPQRVEVWVEKEALAGVFRDVCKRLDVPFLACRGYPSQSEMWRCAQRMLEIYDEQDQSTVILHFGDHDPSGINMTEDIRERLGVVFQAPVDVMRVALTMEQVRKYKPPPNPAKSTDSRFAAYRAKYGDESWELDALEPKVLRQLVVDWTNKYIDVDEMEAAKGREREAKRKLAAMARKLRGA